MKIEEIECRSVLTDSRLPAAKYCINPYIGCLHACRYCYAQFMRRFTGHTGERWGSFLDVKINAPEVLDRELSRRPKRGMTLLGSVTDAYQAAERKYGLTRRILEVLLKYDWPISVLTKSDLVTRDIDLLRQFSQCDVGLTITSLDDQASRNFEPGASLPAKRIQALDELHRAGIKTYAFIGPVLPGLTDVEAIIAGLSGKVDFAMFETLNLGAGTHAEILETVSVNYPDLLSSYTTEAIERVWQELEPRVKSVCAERGIHIGGIFRHGLNGKFR